MQLKLTYSFLGLGTAAILIFLAGSFQKNTVNVYGNKFLDEVNGVLHHKGSPFTGTAIERFPKGHIYKSTEYVDGIKHGIMEEFGFTGAIKHRWNYKKGLRDGAQYGWFLEGPKKYVQNFKDGLLHGLVTEWYISGTLFRQRNFEKGVESASKIRYFTGEMHTNYVKKDGAIYGLKSGELCMDFANDGEIE